MSRVKNVTPERRSLQFNTGSPLLPGQHFDFPQTHLNLEATDDATDMPSDEKIISSFRRSFDDTNNNSDWQNSADTSIQSTQVIYKYTYSQLY